MPITIKPASHDASPVRGASQSNTTPLLLLKTACSKESKGCQELLQSSFATETMGSLGASSNGFVKGAIRAYSEHHHLRIRPEDVWFAILSQLSLYINAHAEELRGKFVAHEGKKELELVYDGVNRYTMDFSVFAKQMGELIEQNVVDPELRRWMMPAFTTTTENDAVVASILLMGAMQKYFDYKCSLLCGLPSVTLLGEKADWELILTRIEKLKEYGEEPTKFYELLRPVISRFVKSFEEPTSKETKDFWQNIAHRSGGGSGPSYYSGWITAFCFWDKDGKTLWRPKSLYSERLELDGVDYHLIETDEVPPGYTSVPVKVDDNGYEFMAKMVAGSIGTRYLGIDTIQPESGWWMFQDDSQESKQ